MTEEYLPLHLKYRPKSLDEISGNRTTVRALKLILGKSGKPHSYLLTGQKGSGKTSIARIIANELKCSKRDFHEMNSANYRGIDSVRELYSSSVRRPWDGDVVVYLMDEAAQITKDGQNALLKLLEEPPKHAYFILATTDPEKLLGTIKSRCAHFAMQSLPRSVIVDRLIYICESEECPETYPTDKAIDEVARQCGGSMRQALIILDQIIDIENEEEALEVILEAAGDDRQVVDLCRGLLKGQRWQYIQKVLKNLDTEPETVRHSVLGYMSSVILNGDNPHAVRIIRHFLSSMMYSGKAGLALACYDVVQEQQKKLTKAV